jgi:ribosomal protein L7Ae-like RNA K-turn-binding protein
MNRKAAQTRPNDAVRRALGLIGLAARAGAVVAGTQEVREAARGDRLRLVLVATDASQNTRDKLKSVVAAPGIDVVEVFDRDTLGRAAGKAPLSALGVMNESFAKPLRTLLLTEDVPGTGEG